MLGYRQKLHEILLTDGSHRVGAMSACLIRNRQQDESPSWNKFDFLLRNAEFRRIDEVIGRVDIHAGAWMAPNLAEGS